MESLARGGTRWKRFAVVMVPSVAATAAIGVAISQGALATSFAVSGQQFKVEASKIEAQGFVQYGAVDQTKAGKKPVTVVGINHAEITDLCQSVVIPVGLPGIDNVSMVIKAGGDGDNVIAKNLYLDATKIDADATFTNIDIGVAAGSVTRKPGVNPQESQYFNPGSFAQQAESATLTNVRQHAWATSAGTFKLSGLHMNVKKGKHECF